MDPAFSHNTSYIIATSGFEEKRLFRTGVGGHGLNVGLAKGLALALLAAL